MRAIVVSTPEERKSEAELISRVVTGDQIAQRTFYDLHVDAVYRVAYRMTRDATLAREFTQDAFVRAFSRLGQFRGESAVRSWLLRVTMSVVLNGLQKIRRQQERETVLADTEVCEPAHLSDDVELEGRLAAAIAKLPPEQRAVLLLYDVDGYRHEDVAEKLRITVSSSKVRLWRARTALRAALAPYVDEFGWRHAAAV